MGIRKLYKFLRERNLIKEYSNFTKYVNIRKREVNFSNRNKKSIIIGIDFWLYAHKFTYSYGNMIIGFWNQIIKLLSHKIIPLYIYDGRPPHEKDPIILQRQRKRANLELKLNNICNEILDQNQNQNQNQNDSINNHLEQLEIQKIKLKKSIIHIKKTDIDIVKEFFEMLHIPYLNAISEADALCAKLFKEGYITACLSDDMDMLALGCGRTLKFQDGKILEFDLEYILEGLNLNYNQFVEMCLLFGCDYIKPMFKLTNDESYNLIKTYGNIESILDNSHHINLNRENEKCQIFINGYMNAKNILIMSSLNEVIPEHFNPLIDTELDPFLVLQYLKTYGNINYVTENMKKILDSIEYINFHISHNSFV